MKNSTASMSQSPTDQQTGTPNFGEVSTIEGDNISLHALTDIALSEEVNQPSVEKREPWNTQLIESLESLGFSARVKSTGNQSAFAALFR